MWLSRLLLDPLDPAQAGLLAEPYRLHQAVMTGFHDGREANGVLYRVEPERYDGRVAVLVQSVVEPSWTGLDGGLPAAPVVKPFALEVAGGDRFRFRLRANPVKRIPAERTADPLRGKRVDLQREEEQLAWLARQAARHGFAPLDVEVVDRGLQTGRRRGAPVTVRLVDFDGHLRVTDPDALLLAVERGLGPAKAFGCGLLSLAPAFGMRNDE